MKIEFDDSARAEQLDRWLAQLKQKLEGSPADYAHAKRTMAALFDFALDDPEGMARAN